MNTLVRPLLAFPLLVLLMHGEAGAATYYLPRLGTESVVGEVEYTTATKDESLLDIARRNGLGYDEIVKANPGVDRWTPEEGAKVVLPKRFILPDAPRNGIVLNLAELRMYYFPLSDGSGESQKVYTFPVSIGRMDWKSPLGSTKIAKKETDPDWRPTESIKAEHAAEGDILPNVVPGGTPENPLGRYALRLGIPGYLIHGTDERKEFGIGMRVTHGCIRMYPEDIALLYSLVDVNTPVLFIDQPVKAGWQGGDLFLELHSPLPEDEEEFRLYSHRVSMDEASALVARRASTALTGVTIDSQLIAQAVEVGDGVPAVVARTASLLPPAKSDTSGSAFEKGNGEQGNGERRGFLREN